MTSSLANAIDPDRSRRVGRGPADAQPDRRGHRHPGAAHRPGGHRRTGRPGRVLQPRLPGGRRGGRRSAWCWPLFVRNSRRPAADTGDPMTVPVERPPASAAGVRCRSVWGSVWPPSSVDRQRGGLMDFTPNPDHEAIREGVRRSASDFPDTYWADKDEQPRVPLGLLQGHGRGRLGRHLHPRGVRRRRSGDHRGHDRAGGGRPVGGGDERLLGRPPLDLRHEPGGQVTAPRSRSASYLPAVADGSLHVAFGVTEPDAGTDTPSITTRARRDGDHYVVRGAQGVDHQGALLRQGPAAGAHHAPRGGQAAHRGHDPVPGRPAAARGDDHARSPRPAATPWSAARSSTTTCPSPPPTASARRAWASPTCSTGSTPSG